MAFKFIIICNEIHIFQNANTIFAKHQKIKRIHLQKKGTFSQENSKILLKKKKKKKLKPKLMVKMMVKKKKKK